MAVTFISKDSENTLLIGGQSAMGGATSGGVGPFPRYSIGREEIATGDGTYINTKHTINITGTATLKTGDSQDMLTAGQRQMRVQGEAIIKMRFNRDEWPMHGAGKLTISSYGGAGNDIVFNDARLTSMELPEQNEESAGVQNLEYSFTFEAYNEVSGTSSNTGANTKDDPDYLLSSAEENWELSVDEGAVAFKDNDISDESPYKSFALTHTVSAVGIKKFASGAGLDTDGEAWRQAIKWVETKLIDNPNAAITTDMMGNTAKTNFNPFYMDKDGDSDNVGYDLSAEYKAYNHVRQVSSDMAAGSYSVTDTWLVSQEDQLVTHDIEVSVESSAEASSNAVAVNGTIQGVSENNPDTNTKDNYTNAKAALTAVLAKAHDLASAVYTSSGLTGTLRTVELNKTLGHNPVTGTITWSISYDDLVVTSDDYLKEEVNVTYNNFDGTDNVIAIMGVVGLACGPIIQDMQTTRERKVSVSVDIVMKKDKRNEKPDGSTSATPYKPQNSYQENKTETWNPKTGAYNFSIGWVFTKCEDIVTGAGMLIEVCSGSAAQHGDISLGETFKVSNISGVGGLGDIVRFYRPGFDEVSENIICGEILSSIQESELETDENGDPIPLEGSVLSVWPDCFECVGIPVL